MRHLVWTCLGAGLVLQSTALTAQAPPRPSTDLDAFMAQALTRRDVDRQTAGDYVLDEVETFEMTAPGRVPIVRKRRDYTWYVRDGVHVRSPVAIDGVSVPDADRRAYEDQWYQSELSRRAFRTTRDQSRADEGKAPASGAPSVNEPRFVSESYFMDFTFEAGNYYLAGKESLAGHDVLKVDYLPGGLRASDDDDAGIRDGEDLGPRAKDAKAAKPPAGRAAQRKEKAFEHKMDETSRVTLWVDPGTHQIVKYTFDYVWLDFLPVEWLVRVQDLRASMDMSQPFSGVWLPHAIDIHATVTSAVGSMEMVSRRSFSNYRQADVSSRIKIPKDDRP